MTIPFRIPIWETRPIDVRVQSSPFRTAKDEAEETNKIDVNSYVGSDRMQPYGPPPTPLGTLMSLVS
jgi:hypothetical protein